MVGVIQTKITPEHRRYAEAFPDTMFAARIRMADACEVFMHAVLESEMGKLADRLARLFEPKANP